MPVVFEGVNKKVEILLWVCLWGFRGVEGAWDSLNWKPRLLGLREEGSKVRSPGSLERRDAGVVCRIELLLTPKPPQGPLVHLGSVPLCHEKDVNHGVNPRRLWNPRRRTRVHLPNWSQTHQPTSRNRATPDTYKPLGRRMFPFISLKLGLVCYRHLYSMNRLIEPCCLKPLSLGTCLFL